MMQFIILNLTSSIKSMKEIVLVLSRFLYHGTISKTVPWLKSVTFIEL